MQSSQPIKIPKNLEPREPLVGPDNTYTTISDRISGVILVPLLKTPLGWLGLFAIAFAGFILFMVALTKLVTTGIGIWGNNVPVGWGMDIINFVWWIGIGHAGTLISAILLLLGQDWRTSINRFAEAMTLFAVCAAGMYPLFHTGRPWLDYWMIPYPNTLGLWQNFQSPLSWDVFAISTYASVSLVFWLVGLIPDFAMMRDKAQNKWVKLIYGTVALGWRGSAKHWHRHELASLILAGLSTPLVVSVHSIVSLDFAASVVPGWNVTVFPPYFVAGAIFAGFAMVVILMLPVRTIFKLQDFITMKHMDVMAKVILATGMIVSYGYLMEVFFSWYSGNEFEYYVLLNRASGPYAWAYWSLWFCNGLAPQLFWFKRFRRSIPALFIVSVIVSIGMWLERFVIIPISLHRDYLPSSWGYYTPTLWDYLFYLGTFGLFFTLLLLFIRTIPMIATFEMRHLLHKEHDARHYAEHVVANATVEGNR